MTRSPSWHGWVTQISWLGRPVGMARYPTHRHKGECEVGQAVAEGGARGCQCVCECRKGDMRRKSECGAYKSGTTNPFDAKLGRLHDNGLDNVRAKFRAEQMKTVSSARL